MMDVQWHWTNLCSPARRRTGRSPILFQRDAQSHPVADQEVAQIRSQGPDKEEVDVRRSSTRSTRAALPMSRTPLRPKTARSSRRPTRRCSTAVIRVSKSVGRPYSGR
jgi:hypothetical protein